MQADEKTKLAAGALRDQLVAVCTAHENEAHAGRPCMANRSEMIAFLAHSLGVNENWWEYAKKLLSEYDAECANRSCGYDADRDFPP